MSVVSDHPMTPTSEREAEIRAYIVTQGEYDSWSIRDVYLDKDAAHAALKRDEDVEEWIIAGPTPIDAARAERDAALAAASPEMVKAIGYERLIREAQEQRDAALAALPHEPWVRVQYTGAPPCFWCRGHYPKHQDGCKWVAAKALRAGGAS